MIKKQNTLKFPITISQLVMISLFCIVPIFARGTENTGHVSVVSSVGIAILAATIVGYIGHILKQPLLLTYILAGALIGPRIGFGFIENIDEIETISHFGLILLLFLIGLEIDIKKLKESGKSLIISGLIQFPLSVFLGIGFFLLIGYSFYAGEYDLFYLAACCSLSSTAIVVKLLYNKFELDTLAGRITLGILVFQDIWAIVLLGIQPNLSDPEFWQILLSFGEGFLLVCISMLLSKFVLPRLFKSVAKIPELILISSLGWCFFICGIAAYFDLSIEMGALIAGISISTFPYNFDVIAKVVNIRDFFVTLFFVSIGMQIPNPIENTGVLFISAIVSLFLISSRLLAIFPVLYSLKNGIRVSLLASINLSQISEFSLVIATLGVTAGHIAVDTLSVIVFVFVITSVLSTYMIKYNNSIQKAIARVLKILRLKDIQSDVGDEKESKGKEIAILGFHRTASSFLYEILNDKENNSSLKEKLLVIDFNPEVHQSLKKLGVKVIYGDISYIDTLYHAGIQNTKIVLSTIPDTILVGTDNMKLLKQVKDICPDAKIIVTAESSEVALKMYTEGAYYVLTPRILSAKKIMAVINSTLICDSYDTDNMIKDEIESLKIQKEVIK